MDWTKHAKGNKKAAQRRLAITVTPELEKAIKIFKASNKGVSFSDTSVVMTMIEAGFSTWAADMRAKASAKDEAPEPKPQPKPQPKRRPVARKLVKRPPESDDPNINPDDYVYEDEYYGEDNEIPYTA